MVCMPDLDLTPNLEELDLHGCKNLEHAHESIAYHAKLRSLNLKECSNLHHLSDVLQSKNLQLLNLIGCSKLQRFPDIPDKIIGLRELDLKGISIEELPASIENLVSLVNLSLMNCKKLANLPSSVYKLPNLEGLILHGCSKLIRFPKKEEDLSDLTGFPKLQYLCLVECNLLEVEFLENHSCFPNLIHLNLAGNNFAKLPTCGQLHNLLHVNVSECRQLQEIGKIPWPGPLQMLWAGNCESLNNIPSDIWAVNNIELLCHEPVRKQFYSNMSSGILLPGGEMPKWLLPNKEGYISFKASKDLYQKFLAFAICIVLRVKEGKQNNHFWVSPYINGKGYCRHISESGSLHSDHVLLFYYKTEELWEVDAFGPNDSGSFQFGIRVSGGQFVKKCGFRLICKPLEDNLETLYEDDKLLDSGLLYETWHDDKETTTEEQSSADLSFQRWLNHGDRKRSSEETDDDDDIKADDDIMPDFSVEKYRYSGISTSCRNILPGRDMPREFVLVEDGTISFMVSQGFYDKFRGLALCVVFNIEDGEKEIFFDIVPHVDGQRRNGLSGSLGSFDSDHMWIQYLKPNVLWGVLEGAVDFLEFDKDYLEFSLTLKVFGGSVEKLGYALICKRMDDDLKAVLEDNQLVNPTSLCETEFTEFLRKFLPRLLKKIEVRERRRLNRKRRVE
ncbi:hypothetical protein BT93_H1622 [Corymbia citriodora subsp. variegata]|nr:hypothetical protein BT93_H1622 [Corymbia citriodora subsp. variegata]